MRTPPRWQSGLLCLLVWLVLGLFNVSIAQARAAPPPSDPSLVGYWTFNDGAGSSAADSSGSGNTATLLNSPTWVSGQIGGALNFDGISQSASVANIAGLASGNTPHTIAAWVKVNALPANRAWILLLGNAGPGAHHWLLNNNGSTQLGSWNGAQVNPSLTVGQWTHIALSFDGTTLTGYINGTAIGALGASFNLTGTPLTLAQAYLSENNFNGQVDDLHIYNRALSAAEVSSLASVPANPVPTVSLTAPTNGATYTAPASITLSATAAESGGTISKVEFYNGATLLGTSTSAPYTVTLANVAAGSYSYTAKAYDSAGTSTTSSPVTITVNAASAAPSVSLTAPIASQTYTAPASITLSASAAESGGTISRVDFYSGASLLGAATAAPYTYTWSNVPAGSYTFTAVATDTNNVSTTSSAVSVSVGAAAVTQVYYIYTDQLNTPRLITDSANTPVWRNDQADPFNASVPYDDPGNTGHHFVFNLRFPGQYYDQETGLAYNYFRDYDPTTGRYVQSDPIGLRGGMNPYAYTNSNPLGFIDPLGLFEAIVNDPGSKSGPTYGGTITVTGNNGQTVTVPGSSWPNPNNPNPGVAPGNYTGTYSPTGHHGTDPAIRVNNGGNVPTVGPNPNQNGRNYANQIEMHCGWSNRNRGSAGCITISPNSCSSVWSILQPGETGNFTITR